MPGCSNYPIDVDSSLCVTPGSQICPIAVDKPEPTLWVSLAVTIIKAPPCTNQSQLQRSHMVEYILPYINRIYEKAGIQFYLKSWKESNQLQNPIYNSNTDNYGPTFKPIESLFNRRFLTDATSQMNIFVVGQLDICGYNTRLKINGVYNGKNYTIIGETYDDDGETLRWNLGRFGLTLAHELGHGLNLDHNPGREYLMYPTTLHQEDPRVGEAEQLSNNEINTMRNFVPLLTPWTFNDIIPPSTIIIE